MTLLHSEIMKALTYSKYRAINIILLSVIFSAIETLIAKGANIWFPELGYTLSLAVIFVSLEMMRWNGFGAVSAVLSGLVFCLASGANGQQYLIYCIGNSFALLALLYIKFVGPDKIRKSVPLTLVYVVMVFLLVQGGRWCVSTILGNDPRLIIQFLTTDALSGVFGIVVILVMRNVDGMFENQRSYLRRLEEERKKKTNGQV